AFFALSPYGASLTNNGMESGLLFFGLCLLSFVLLHAEGALNSQKKSLVVGVILSLIVFSRLDSVFLVASFYGISIATVYVREGFRGVYRAGIDLLVVSIPLAATLITV